MTKIFAICMIMLSSTSVLSAADVVQTSLRQPLSQKTFAVLIFTKTEPGRYQHASTPVAVESIKNLGVKTGFQVTASSDPKVFSRQGLLRFDAVIFINNSGDILNVAQQNAFRKYIESGHGVVVLHAGIRAEEDWPWFSGLLGVRFSGHPEIQKASVMLTNREHRVNRGLPKRWQRQDEWYNFAAISRDITPLILVDESTYEGGIHGDFHPVAWLREQGKGRVFCSVMGHSKGAWSSEIFLRHITNGIIYAAVAEND